MLLVNLNVPGTDYASTMAAIAKEPKKYFFALSSGGSAGHVATLEFLRRTKLPLDTVLYKGTAPANADLLSGSVQLFMDPWTALLPLARAGKARGLFVTSKARTALAPDIPTTDEVGLKDFNISSWYGVWAPKGTPDPIVDGWRWRWPRSTRTRASSPRRARSASCRRRAGRRTSRPSSRARSTPNTTLLRDAGYKPE